MSVRAFVSCPCSPVDADGLLDVRPPSLRAGDKALIARAILVTDRFHDIVFDSRDLPAAAHAMCPRCPVTWVRLEGDDWCGSLRHEPGSDARRVRMAQAYQYGMWRGAPFGAEHAGDRYMLRVRGGLIKPFEQPAVGWGITVGAERIQAVSLDLGDGDLEAVLGVLDHDPLAGARLLQDFTLSNPALPMRDVAAAVLDALT